jgi:hypothetical protein
MLTTFKHKIAHTKFIIKLYMNKLKKIKLAQKYICMYMH